MTTRILRNIINILKKLDCPILGDNADAWMIEILLKPNFERYHLIEWIFSKLGFSIPDVSVKKLSSSEKKLHNLLAAVSALGLCHEGRSDIIEGTAPLEDQLRFWNLLVNILWKKINYLSRKKDENSNDRISDEYEKNRNYISKLCYSVNFKHLFEKKLQLFPKHILKECEENYELNRAEFEGLAEIKSLVDTKLQTHKQLNLRISPLSEKLSSFGDDSVFPHHEQLNDLETKLSWSLADLQKYADTDFKEAYLNLKPHLTNISNDEFIDAGPSFKTSELQLESLAQLNKALSMLKESDVQSRILNSDLEKVHLSQGPLSDSLLGEYFAILNDDKKLQE